MLDLTGALDWLDTLLRRRRRLREALREEDTFDRREELDRLDAAIDRQLARLRDDTPDLH